MPKAPKGGFYAVQVGRHPGVYHTWPEAQAQVTGFPKALHQKFKTLEDAQAYVKGTSATFSKSSASSGSSSTGSGSSSRTSNSRSTTSHSAKPYDRPSKPNQSARAKGQSNANTLYNLNMEWTRQVEDQLIKAGWLVVFTDGACQANGKHKAAAGAGVFWTNPRGAKNLSERVPGKQSNQTGELYAILRALEEDPEPSSPMQIFTDSQYSIKCLTEWIDGWMAKGWKTSEGGPVINAGLIKLIHFMISKRDGPIQFSWVKGHSNVPGNKSADWLAVQGRGRDLPRMRDFEAEREERFQAYRSSKRKAQEAAVPASGAPVEEINESWLLDPHEELAELEQDF